MHFNLWPCIGFEGTVGSAKMFFCSRKMVCAYFLWNFLDVPNSHAVIHCFLPCHSKACFMPRLSRDHLRQFYLRSSLTAFSTRCNLFLQKTLLLYWIMLVSTSIPRLRRKLRSSINSFCLLHVTPLTILTVVCESCSCILIHLITIQSSLPFQ
jgi:hypothetical protein